MHWPSRSPGQQSRAEVLGRSPGLQCQAAVQEGSTGPESWAAVLGRSLWRQSRTTVSLSPRPQSKFLFPGRSSWPRSQVAFKSRNPRQHLEAVFKAAIKSCSASSNLIEVLFSALLCRPDLLVAIACLAIKSRNSTEVQRGSPGSQSLATVLGRSPRKKSREADSGSSPGLHFKAAVFGRSPRPQPQAAVLDNSQRPKPWASVLGLSLGPQSWASVLGRSPGQYEDAVPGRISRSQSLVAVKGRSPSLQSRIAGSSRPRSWTALLGCSPEPQTQAAVPGHRPGLQSWPAVQGRSAYMRTRQRKGCFGCLFLSHRLPPCVLTGPWWQSGRNLQTPKFVFLTSVRLPWKILWCVEPALPARGSTSTQKILQEDKNETNFC